MAPEQPASGELRPKKLFEPEGPAGLLESPRRKVRESALPEVTRRAILMLKESNPDWGSQRISDMLAP